MTTYEANEELPLESLGIALPLSVIYKDVKFNAGEYSMRKRFSWLLTFCSLAALPIGIQYAPTLLSVRHRLLVAHPLSIQSRRLPAVGSSPAQAPVRIALVTDTQCTRGKNGDLPRYKVRFDRVIAAVNAAAPSLVLVAGDVTNGGRVEQMEDFKEQTKGFKAPVLWVPGNHDVGNRQGLGERGSVSAQKIRRFERALGPSYHSFETAGVRVVALNASLFGSGLMREGQQWKWLEKELARRTTLPTLVLLHYPLFLKSPDEPDDPRQNVLPEARTRLLNLFKTAAVKAVLSGHLHRPLVNQYAGAPYITSPATAYGLPAKRQPCGWTLLTLTPDGNVKHEFRYIQE